MHKTDLIKEAFLSDLVCKPPIDMVEDSQSSKQVNGLLDEVSQVGSVH